MVGGMKEKRRLERFELMAPTFLTLDSGGKSRERLQLVTKDISSDGAYLFCSQPLSEGSRVRMDLYLSLDKLSKIAGEVRRAKIRLKGTVVRLGTDGMAIRFESKYRINALGSDADGSLGT
jgi:hypothetical protein